MTEQAKQQAHEHEKEHDCNSEFNLTNEYLEHVAPLMTQIHAKCKELGLPFVLAIKHFGDGESTGQGFAANFVGCRTPIEYHAVEAMVTGSTPKPLLALVMAATERQKH